MCAVMINTAALIIPKRQSCNVIDHIMTFEAPSALAYVIKHFPPRSLTKIGAYEQLELFQPYT